jgi:hypothetical protein
VRVAEGKDLDPTRRAELEEQGWEEVHRSRIGWFGAEMGENIHFRRPIVRHVLRPIRRRG